MAWKTARLNHTTLASIGRSDYRGKLSRKAPHQIIDEGRPSCFKISRSPSQVEDVLDKIEMEIVGKLAGYN